MALSLPSRRGPSTDGHTCTLTLVHQGQEINLASEEVCRELGLPEGTTLTCEATVTRNGKPESCGRQHRLRYPRAFSWVQVRNRATDADTEPTSSDSTPAEPPLPNVATPTEPTPAEPVPAGAKGRRS